MQKVLNQEEIDALFQRAQGQKTDGDHGRRQVASCDFGSSGQITKEQLRLITGLHETFARNLTHGLGAYLRVGLEIAVVSVEQLTYSEFLQRVPDLTYLASVKINELNAIGVLNMELPIAYSILDLLLGGRGRPEAQLRELTEIEEEILSSIMMTTVKELSNCWEPMGLTFALDRRQASKEAADILSAVERVLTVSFEIRLPETQAMLNVVVPVAVSSLMQHHLHKGMARHQGNIPQNQHLRNRMLQSNFPLELTLPSVRVPSSQILDLRAGSILMLPYKVQEPIQLKVAGTALFAAFPVAKNDRRAGYINRITAGPKRENGGENVSK